MADVDRTPWRREFANDYPCKRDCPDRHMACHTGCIKYMKAKEDNAKKKAEAQAKKRAECDVTGYIVINVSKATGKPIKSR